LRRSSREIAEPERPARRAISRTPQPRARKIAISSRSVRTGSAPARGLADRPHAASFTEPPRADRRRHAGLHCGILARQPAPDHRPEPLPLFPPPPRAAGQATASGAGPPRPAGAALAPASQLLTVEALGRPIESAQYTSVRFAQILLPAGLTPSVGTVGDALDNALAETSIGLYKPECIRAGSPFRAGPERALADLDGVTSAWVHWYNTARLMRRLGRRPPAEAEAGYYQQAKAAA
jgi:hypothetical protein